MRRHFSISLRLTGWFSAIFLFGFLVFGAVMWGDLSYSLSAGRDKTLAGRAKRLQDLLENFRRDPPQRRIAKFADFIDATPEGNLIQVFNSAGARVYPPAAWPAMDFPWPSWSIAGGLELSKHWYSGRLYRVLSEPISIGPDRFRILVAGQLEDNRALLKRFEVGLFWATPAILALSALCGYFLSGRALSPVARLTTLVRSISIGNLSRRLPIFHTRDELQQLAETCNDMLARLEIAVNQITRFTSDASHELRSPISFIHTLAEYALRNPHIDPESAESFREIVRESGEASRLLEDMLALARSDAGHAEVAFEPVNLIDVLFETCARAQPFVDAKRHEMTLQIKNNEPVWITGDGASLRRLLWILLDNAIKYTPSGGHIDVSLHTAGTEAQISVRDSGIGIPDAALPHVFERFYRADQARASEEGAGLGLAIAKWISDIHLAALSVTSKESLSSTFQVVFRLLA
ncbi:MAG TPA: ATP-binding protein [Bryobacteraceae bacterium]